MVRSVFVRHRGVGSRVYSQRAQEVRPYHAVSAVARSPDDAQSFLCLLDFFFFLDDLEDFFFDFFRLLPESSSESVEADRLARLRSFLCLRFLRFLLLLRAWVEADGPPSLPAPPSESALLSDEEESESELLDSLELPPPDLPVLEDFSILLLLLLLVFPVAPGRESRVASSGRCCGSPETSRR